MEDELIQVYVHGVVVDPVTNSTIVLLVDMDKMKVLPLWIGAFEALAISQVLGNQKNPRPLTHDLIVNIFRESKSILQRTVIYTIKDNTFYAYLVLGLDDERRVRVDSRPSDAIAVAIRTSSPIYVSEEVYSVAIDYNVILDHNQMGGEVLNSELDSSEVKDWINKIKPSDF